ncbi:uracil-DNA glycosylase [Caloranaerobacter azorensis H53214]|uniref:Type-4 uracil-DNA glycosylase n=1 Tax=Caloranaerobacter azorensis H53214 TaxID=1156417 RepID=A0A096BF79_9FIRM|nr:uracil-DNA glycosylase [Caloranaerobacter azorensis]KGG79507.1 uracil-DNA glycosylase [Caloranaerobacter azorensis H53214]
MKQKRLENLNRRIKQQFADKELVFGDGSVNSLIMLIGEAPGANEVKQRKPFVGQAGEQLKEFLNILELERKDLYITNVVKFRPTRISKKTGKLINRAPNKMEINDFKEYLFEEIDIINPQIIIPLGNVPLKALINNELQISKEHGKILRANVNGNVYKIYPLYHPAAVIYRRGLKKIYIEDLMKLKDVIPR